MSVFDQLLRDVRHAVRSLARAPIVAGVVILSLGVGIGVNTVVFSWIQAIVFRPIPGVSDAASLYVIEPRTGAGVRPGTSWPEYLDLRERLQPVTELAAFRMTPLNVGESSRSERSYALLVSGNYFAALGLEAAAGRLLGPGEVVRPGAEPVVVISYDYWQTRYGGAPSAIGRKLRVSDHELTIVGVTPEGFQGTVLALQFDLWVPATLAPTLLSGTRELTDRAARGYYAVGRLQDKAAVSRAGAEVAETMRLLAHRFPETNASMQAELRQFWRASRGPQEMLLRALTILQGVMVVLLLAVCGNTANLLLARAGARQRDVSVRLAVGAGWWRILRLLLVENLVMSLLAAVVGTLIAVWGTNAFRAVPLLTTQFPVRFQTEIDVMSLLFAAGLGVLCALVFGFAPALQLARVDPQTVLRGGSSLSPRSRMRNVLMGAEVALALAVLIAAALFFQSFRQTQDTDPGFRREGVLLAAYDLSGRGLDAAGTKLFATRLLERLRRLPDVEVAAVAASMPLDIHGLPARSFVLEGRARPEGPPERTLSNIVTPGYFAVMGIPILAGSDFADLADVSAPAQAIVNQAFVHRYVGSGEALGRRIEVSEQPFVIVGIVRDSIYESFSEGPTPIVYLSYRDRPSRAGEIHVRTRLADESMLASSIRAAVRDVDGSLPIYNVRTLAQHVDMSLAMRKIPARLFIVLGPLILALAAIGIYAVVAYSVAQRTAEIGVRVALGATAERVVRQIVKEGLQVIAVGAIVGWLIAAFVYTHLIRQALDLTVFAGVPALLLAMATFACWVPARQASLVDPMVALRTD